MIEWFNTVKNGKVIFKRSGFRINLFFWKSKVYKTKRFKRFLANYNKETNTANQNDNIAHFLEKKKGFVNKGNGIYENGFVKVEDVKGSLFMSHTMSKKASSFEINDFDLYYKYFSSI